MRKKKLMNAMLDEKNKENELADFVLWGISDEMRGKNILRENLLNCDNILADSTRYPTTVVDAAQKFISDNISYFREIKTNHEETL